ncbi:MAG TPA: hypothetical protein VJ385_08895 [Fibrobacteria bacterium]|nr:hypothetical protein [Fibrobacteria bacterium]
MDRRTFLETGASALAALALPGPARGQTCANATERDNYGAGPFYLANAPQRRQLAGAFEPGQRIAISGTVRNCGAPIASVGLDVWHATESGCYRHPDDVCPDIPGHPEPFRLRGKMATDAQGRYAFESVLPGAYLNGSRYRPRHIHVIISHPSLEADLITQLYFAGDPYIPGDAGADDANAANRIIPLVKTVPALWTGTWDIRLPGATAGLGRFDDPAYADFDVAVRRRGDTFILHLPALRSGNPVELRLYGPDGTLADRSLHREIPLEVETSRLRHGAYLADLRWRTDRGMRSESVTLRK